MGISVESTVWLFSPLFPVRIGIWKCWFLWREENRRTRRKTLGAETRTNNKLNPHMTTKPGIEPGPHWWEASALTTLFCVSIKHGLRTVTHTEYKTQTGYKIADINYSSKFLHSQSSLVYSLSPHFTGFIS